MVIASAIVLFATIGMINRRTTGSYLRMRLRWLMSYTVLIGIGIGSWFSFVDWVNRLMLDAFTEDVTIEAVDELE